MIKKASYIVLITSLIWLLSCNKQQATQQKTTFTKIDSLTETYLILQDSLLHAWNVMVWDEKEKTKAMHGLIQMMHQKEEFDDKELVTLEQRLDQLDRIRFTQKSLANNYVIEEYDFASNSLVSEILSLAEADTEFVKNMAAQRLIDKVKMSEQRVGEYRSQYDRVASRYNAFLEKNKDYIKEIDKDYTGEKRALFRMAYD
ncbi:MAG TPA: hypothetical protein PKN99_04720 [Cyclobacteriaceae bacterium]|jgi:hypothetical protein|nr:hypothetical protein [Cyclobacteriaceae bacterium]HNP06903.1 hypothetical protein [Cyclobacteriaceae bacterium]HRK53162.1 hypothetical protein [Cyclobacteriaceae bacterium]